MYQRDLGSHQCPIPDISEEVTDGKSPRRSPSPPVLSLCETMGALLLEAQATPLPPHAKDEESTGEDAQEEEAANNSGPDQEAPSSDVDTVDNDNSGPKGDQEPPPASAADAYKVAYMDDVFHGNVVEITGPADSNWTISDPPVYINPRCMTCGLEECVQEVECIAKYLKDLKEADKAEENKTQ